MIERRIAMPFAHRALSSLRAGVALAITATALIVMAVATANASESRLGASTTTCPVISGTPWVAPAAPYPHGSKYDVNVHGKGWTCQKADAYILKLVANKV